MVCLFLANLIQNLLDRDSFKTPDDLLGSLSLREAPRAGSTVVPASDGS